MSDKNLQLCRFCQMHVKLAYYCEECGASCCSDCLHEEKIDFFVCQDCNSRNIEIQEGNGNKVCKDCGKENVIKITQHLKSCPKCHAHKILNIYEKKEELEQRFLELIKESRSFIKPLRDINNELYILRHKIKVARGPPIKCYHYPKMESELLALFKIIIHLKENLLGKINTHFRHLALNKMFFFDIYNQHNSNIRIIESILDNMCRSHDSINKYIINTVNEISEKFEMFRNNLKFIDKITKLFLPYKRFLNLAEHEKPVYAIKTKLINGLDNQNRFRKNKGILFITNFDLSFVHEFGVVKKKQELIFKAPVDDLIKISDKGKLFKKLYIQFDYGKYEFSLPSNVVSKIIDYILLARSFRDNATFDNETAKELHEIDLDLNDLNKYIEEGINSFFSLKIKYAQDLNSINNKEFGRDYIYKSNQAYLEGSQNKPQNPYHQNQSHPQYWSQKHINSHLYSKPPENPIHYGNFNHPPYVRNSHIGTPEDYNYFRNNFYSQNIYNPYRFQNYKPSNYYDHYSGPYMFNNRPDFDERNILMKRLEKVQKYGRNFPPQQHGIREDLFNEIPAYRDLEPSFNNDVNRSYKDNLSDIFNTNNRSINNSYINDSENLEYNKNNRKKMIDLKKEKFSLKETLKKLDAKFDQGIISEVDYFKTFKNLQKEIYLIDKKIKFLKDKVKDEQFLRRNYNQKRYYT